MQRAAYGPLKRELVHYRAPHHIKLLYCCVFCFNIVVFLGPLDFITSPATEARDQAPTPQLTHPHTSVCVSVSVRAGFLFMSERRERNEKEERKIERKKEE